MRKIMKKNNGFTLIEVMVTVAIVAIVSSIALPAYSDYIVRAQITEGIASLSDMRVKMEQYFQDNRTYVGACQNNTLAPIPSDLKYFTIQCSDLSDNTYLLTATGKDFVYNVNETNLKSTSSVPTGWATSASCWITNKTGQCQ